MDVKFPITIFPDKFAFSKEQGETTLSGLASGIRTTTAPKKSELPFIKLALFGDSRTQKGCLRNNANVLAITGVEGDYDKGRTTFGEAVRLSELSKSPAKAAH